MIGATEPHRWPQEVADQQVLSGKPPSDKAFGHHLGLCLHICRHDLLGVSRNEYPMLEAGFANLRPVTEVSLDTHDSWRLRDAGGTEARE